MTFRFVSCVAVVVGLTCQPAAADEADWQARANGPGVRLATNFDYANTDALKASEYQPPGSAGAQSQVQLETGIKRSGNGSFRSNITSNSGTVGDL